MSDIVAIAGNLDQAGFSGMNFIVEIVIGINIV